MPAEECIVRDDGYCETHGRVVLVERCLPGWFHEARALKEMNTKLWDALNGACALICRHSWAHIETCRGEVCCEKVRPFLLVLRVALKEGKL